jgi:hypothetical protein
MWEAQFEHAMAVRLGNARTAWLGGGASSCVDVGLRQRGNVSADDRAMVGFATNPASNSEAVLVRLQ